MGRRSSVSISSPVKFCFLLLSFYTAANLLLPRAKFVCLNTLIYLIGVPKPHISPLLFRIWGILSPSQNVHKTRPY
ncbi:hypothetical protein B0J12DRAFT_673204 [Macrophomina phaseolina]|uniref:Secreted protein n=1 Tax=Macrophomina phaseolina TaxID=35725 RepID=A0ABQ8G2L8_9PEZI|nr:hypothetical protein B0J12DRAFT_673204 [Macrophomina phaseolina]